MKATKCAFFVSAAMAVLGITGCATQVQKAALLTPIEVPSGKDASPLQFKKIVVKLGRGEVLGKTHIGVFCVPAQDFTWQGGRTQITADDFTEAFRDELQKANYPVVGNPDALFEDPSEWKAELLVAGMIKKMEVNLCYPMAGFGDYQTAKGGVFARVDWQIYSRLNRKVVYEVSTEGSYQDENAQRGKAQDLFVGAFARATQNLLADRGFHDLVVRAERNAPATSALQKIVLKRVPVRTVPIASSMTDIRAAVVTVFAGNGHGSGFFVSPEGYLLTNEHVVREAKFVKIRLATGREILGEVMRTDSVRDVALVKVEESSLPALAIGKSEPNVGEDVYAIGTPLDQKLTSTLTRGVLSAYRVEDGKRFIQSDTQILPGNSGGPLVNQNGTVVGISTAGLFMRGAPTGLNFFVPIGEALSALALE